MPKRQTARRGASRSMPLLFLAVGVVLIAAAAWITLAQPGQKDKEPFRVTGPSPEVPRISPADARSGMDGRNALMVDVRSERDFAAARISGAVHIPDADIGTRYQELPEDRPIYLYCT